MHIKLSEARTKLVKLLATSGASDGDIQIMTDLLLDYELHGNTFSGLAEAEHVIEDLRASAGKQYLLEVNKPSVKLINANGRSARLVGMEIIPMLCQMAREHGIAMVGVYNGGYQGTLEPYSRAIAAQGLVGIVSANGGPQGVVPFGGRKDVLGTNPLSYGIPTDDLPIVFDGATSKYPYGAIRLAKERGQRLPEHSFLTSEGAWTTDPAEAVSIVPFGDHKGYAINLLLEVMTGCLVRGKSGLQQHSTDELGSFQIAIDPAMFGSLDDFKAQTAQLAKDIEAVQPADGYDSVRVPGYSGERTKQAALSHDMVEVADDAWKAFQSAYSKFVKE